ncbi:Uncharacterised protein [Mycobacteroides abscessus subsp. abscessus]|nr:Uncharacterised protein [Mycobacteroides abscessus subsp. abscessus]
MSHPRLQLGNELHCGRACSDDGNPLTFGGPRVIPLRRVEDIAVEVVESGNVGSGRLAERPRRADENIGGECRSVDRQTPDLSEVIPRRIADVMAAPDVRGNPEIVSAPGDVRLDLTLQWVQACPVRIRGERERVQRRRDVALRTGVRVDLPRSADICGALEHHEVVESVLQAANRGADATEPRADDRHVKVSSGRVVEGWVVLLGWVLSS